ncbi:MAG: CheR family methyltransferase [Bdellovibrionota bacterium]
MPDISPEDYYLISHLVRGQSGLDLGEGKEYLITSRIEPLLPQLGLASLQELFQILRSKSHDSSLGRTISEAMATHESLFFRDKLPFEYLVNDMVPRLSQAARPREKIRIWSAACSFGQEPYSILFSIEEAPVCLRGIQVEVIATDFSRFAISRAQAGTYSQFELQRGLTPEQIHKYFEPCGQEARVRERIRSKVDFREMNFLDSFASIGQVDIIFCRNVLIYFDLPMKKEILERMEKILAPDGYLVLGSTESILGVTEVFTRREEWNCSVFTPVSREGK